MSKTKYPSDKMYAAFFKERADINLMACNEQLDYADAIINKDIDIIFSNSDAGTGKTSTAIVAGAYMLEMGLINKIIYVRAPVATREIGHLPGTLEEKSMHYFKPLRNTLNRLSSLCVKGSSMSTNYDKMIDNGLLETYITTHVRGDDWLPDSLILIDEAQNLNLLELKSVITRAHDGCKVVVVGSTSQIDDPDNIDKYGKYTPFEVCIKHFIDNNPYDDLVCKEFKLTHNHRGKISTHADRMHDTAKKCMSGYVQ